MDFTLHHALLLDISWYISIKFSKQITNLFQKTISKSWQTSDMELFAKIVKN